MITIIEDGIISSKIAKKVFVHLAKNGGGAREYVEKAGMVQISDPAYLDPNHPPSLPITKLLLPRLQVRQT